jgi:hypothetical protein
MKRRASGSIPADGASSRMIGGLPTIAIATESFRLFPPERVPEAFDLYFYKSSFRTTSSMSFYLFSNGIPLMRAKYSIF